jgi:hypothetical protein
MDANDTLPEPRTAALDEESGRGLTLVAALADTWGAEPREGGIGKTVWYELACEPCETLRTTVCQGPTNWAVGRRVRLPDR